MLIVPHMIAWLWLGFAVVWLVSAAFNKKRRRGAPWSFWGLRLLLVVTIVAWARLRQAEPAFFDSLAGHRWLQPGMVARWIGVGLCAGGLAFAFWARFHIGRNWGTPMSLRENHELVTTGPYHYVRHPIYAGVMLAMLGTALATDIAWLALFVVYVVYFLFAARTEERTMLAQFPRHYPDYQRRTKRLIPFVL